MSILNVYDENQSIPTQPVEEIYSTEETRIGTWIDGKPLYRITLMSTAPSSIKIWTTIAEIQDLDTVVDCFYTNIIGTNEKLINDSNLLVRYDGNAIKMYAIESNRINRSVTLTIKYTKTTD